MTDSNARERLDSKHGRDRQRRIEAIKRWVEYIRSEPPETWGPQQNAVVDGQLDAARAAEATAAHRQRTKEIADDLLTIGDRESGEPRQGNIDSGEVNGSDADSDDGSDVDGTRNR